MLAPTGLGVLLVTGIGDDEAERSTKSTGNYPSQALAWGRVGKTHKNWKKHCRLVSASTQEKARGTKEGTHSQSAVSTDQKIWTPRRPSVRTGEPANGPPAHRPPAVPVAAHTLLGWRILCICHKLYMATPLSTQDVGDSAMPHEPRTRCPTPSNRLGKPQIFPAHRTQLTTDRSNSPLARIAPRRYGEIKRERVPPSCGDGYAEGWQIAQCGAAARARADHRVKGWVHAISEIAASITRRSACHAVNACVVVLRGAAGAQHAETPVSTGRTNLTAAGMTRNLKNSLLEE
ncbi:hypothetical protein C8R45DRAFT_917783 [Mycena sanguinolenta]|nr:hypothetical protein C8R45DRAFT_917783 [Mycena sanguinolenta]